MNKKLAAERRGHAGEALAGRALRLKGYRILGRRVRTPLGEIDMFALPVFGPACLIEVKARADAATAALSVGETQRTRIARAANLYLAGRPKLARRGARFDIIAAAAAGRLLAPAPCRFPACRRFI